MKKNIFDFERLGFLFAFAMFALFASACSSSSDTEIAADLVVTNARIWTSDAKVPWAEALAVKGDRIVAVGDASDIAPYIGSDTDVINAPPGMVVPGFIDTHVHFLFGGFALSSVQLRDVATPDEFRDRIAAHVATLAPGEWILAGDWDHENWGGNLPTSEWVDAVTPDNPMMINRLDGHMVLANSAALALAGVTADTLDVAGGEIVRDAEGAPTGILKDNAMALVSNMVPAPSEQQFDRALQSAFEYMASHGVTTVHDMADFDSLATYRRALSAGNFNTRVYSVVPLEQWSSLAEEVARNGLGDEWLRIGGLKGFMDGSLGSHTAAFFEPYTDAPDDSGMMINSMADMRRWIAGADKAGLHIIVHAIGDRAISELLDIYEEIESNSDATQIRERRFRIEHAQHLHSGDIERIAEQNVIASMQPYHAIDDGRWAERVIGAERAKTTYAFRSLLDAGVDVTFGSDWTVAPAIPLSGIYAAVTRRTLDDANPGGWVPEQKITVEEALIAYTRTAAYASFEEDIKGTLAPGKLADFVLLDQDITKIAAESIRDVNVMRTVIGGRTVYRAGDNANERQ